MSDTVRAEAVREGQEYGGMRITLMATLGKARIPLQVDVGAGDAVVPPPDTIDYPGLLDLPRARLRVYRPETSIAEKTEAMVRLALVATFERRQTPLPSEMPIALTKEFRDNLQKGRQWEPGGPWTST